MFIDILNYKVFNGTKTELIDFIKKRERVNIISGNPEVLYNGLCNRDIYSSYIDETSLIIPDGVGTLAAAKILSTPFKEKLAGIEIMDEIVKLSCEKKKSVYFLGATQEILDNCLKNIKHKYPNIIIAGANNGFFDLKKCDDIVQDIRSSKANIIFVAMGSPRQEYFISKYMDDLPCEIFMGVGGSFDIIAGKLNRAPKWMINFGIEWLYRVIKEPFRVKRLFVIPKFLLRVIKSKRKGRNEKNN